MKTTTVLLVGVGGQGTITAAHLLAGAAMRQGFDVKVSEIHGMSQRAGSVSTVVRFGSKVNSMIADIASCDIVVSFETTEALRYFEFLSKDGLLVSNDCTMPPAPVLTGSAEMPKNVAERIQQINGLLIPADELAVKAGTIKASNVVLLGALSNRLPFSDDVWLQTISEMVPAKFKEANLEAFKLGQEYASSNLK